MILILGTTNYEKCGAFKRVTWNTPDKNSTSRIGRDVILRSGSFPRLREGDSICVCVREREKALGLI
jgi:hypothetical protein